MSVIKGMPIIPRKLSNQKPKYYTLYMSIGFVISSILICGIYMIKGYEMDLTNPLLVYAAIAGVLSMVASISLVIAIDKIGMSRSNQWKNLQGPIGALLIFFIFGEASTTKIYFLFFAILAIFLSAMLLTIKNETEGEEFDKKGIVYALISALFYGVNALMRKYTSDANLIYEQQLYSAVFMLLTCLVYIAIKDKSMKKVGKLVSRDNFLALLAGIVYYFATYFFITAYKYMQGSIAYTIVQLNTIFTIFFGICVFKELEFKKNWLRISLGVILAIVGLVRKGIKEIGVSCYYP